MIYIALLRMTPNATKAGEYLAGHNAWINKAIEDDVFLLTGTITPRAGGAILAHGLDRPAFDALLQQDPFVANDIVTVEVLEIAPSAVADSLAFLKSAS